MASALLSCYHWTTTNYNNYNTCIIVIITSSDNYINVLKTYMHGIKCGNIEHECTIREFCLVDYKADQGYIMCLSTIVLCMFSVESSSLVLINDDEKVMHWCD